MNKIILIGNVGAEPEQKAEGHVNIRLAVTERGYTKQDGTQVPDHTDWFHVAIFGGLSKVAQYIHKGSKVCITGKMRCYTVVDQQTQAKRDFWGVTAEDIELLSPKPQDANNTAQAAPQQGYQQAPQQQAYQAPQQVAQPQYQQAPHQQQYQQPAPQYQQAPPQQDPMAGYAEPGSPYPF